MAEKIRTVANRAFRPGVGPAGFTLVEMLAVVAILGILLALVVGVSRYVIDESSAKETVVTQEVVMDAYLSYGGAVPDDPDGKDGCVDLMKFLYGTTASKNKIAGLSASAWRGQNEPLLDGWGNKMRWRNAGGIGGTPAVISPGADAVFDTDDDIRRDKR